MSMEEDNLILREDGQQQEDIDLTPYWNGYMLQDLQENLSPQCFYDVDESQTEKQILQAKLDIIEDMYGQRVLLCDLVDMKKAGSKLELNNNGRRETLTRTLQTTKKVANCLHLLYQIYSGSYVSCFMTFAQWLYKVYGKDKMQTFLSGYLK